VIGLEATGVDPEQPFMTAPAAGQARWDTINFFRPVPTIFICTNFVEF
jgi:hypothetical protein